MKWIRDAVGEPRRPWYDDAEIERLVEIELARFDFGADEDAVDLELLAEQHFGVDLDQHAVLPLNVLGVTDFLLDQRCRILINRDLTLAMETASARLSVIGRWRATLAHELGHVLLHRILYKTHEAQIDMFSSEGKANGTVGMRCLRDSVGTAAVTTDWREVQANKAMAAFLMPRDRFTAAFVKASASRRDIADSLSQQFMVSKQAALIRVRELGLAVQTRGLFS